MSLAASYFDGRFATAHAVRLRIAAGRLEIEPALDASAVAADPDPSSDHDTPGAADRAPAPQSIALADVHWSEQQRHGVRMARLPAGASLHCQDAAAWDAMRARAGLHEGLVVRAEQSWRGVLVAATCLIALSLIGWLWGIPLAGRAITAVVPTTIDASIGRATLRSLQGDWLRPSGLSPARQQAIRQAFEQTVAAGFPADQRPDWVLHFAAARGGPNAFALPGGIIIMTDALVELAGQEEPLATDMIVGVLAHEMGHVHHRDGMRMIVQATLIGAAFGAAFGDFSTVLLSAPTLLLSRSYSRDAERGADAESIRLLRASGRSPAVMANFFERVERALEKAASASRAERAIGIALSSHPPTPERIQRFLGAAATSGAP